MKFFIIILFFIIPTANGQENKNYETDSDYEVIYRSGAEIFNSNKKLKKYSKREVEDLRFSKELASIISKELFSKIDKITICKETSIVQKKDTITYFVYDFTPKQNLKIDQLKNNLSLGIKHIGLYEWPITCVAFLNDDKITCACKRIFISDFTATEDFINNIKANTITRTNSIYKN